MKRMRLVWNELYNELYLADLSRPNDGLCQFLDHDDSWNISSILTNKDLRNKRLLPEDHILDEWTEAEDL